MIGVMRRTSAMQTSKNRALNPVVIRVFVIFLKDHGDDLCRLFLPRSYVTRCKRYVNLRK
jgi:hypothetical protein